MKSYSREAMSVPGVKEALEITDEERQALAAYKGVGKYVELNEILGGYMTMIPVFIQDRDNPNGDKSYYGRTPEKRREHIRTLIEMSAQIYSAMYKSGVARVATYGQGIGKDFARGSSHRLLDGGHGFISTTSLDRRSDGLSPMEEALNWAILNNSSFALNSYGVSNYSFRDSGSGSYQGVLSHVHVSSDVPYIFVEGGNQNERETLISPFTTIEKDELRGRFSNGAIEAHGKRLREEFVVVEARPLTHLPQEEQKRLYDEIMSQADEIDSKIVEYYQITKDINNIVETRQYLEKKEKELNSQYDMLRQREETIKKEILQWRAKLSSLIEARCADKEHEIESKIDIVIGEREAEERRKREAINQGTARADDIRGAIFGSVDSAMQSEAYTRMANCQVQLEHAGKIASRNGLKFNSPIRDLTRAIEGLKRSGNYLTISPEGHTAFDTKGRGGYSIRDQLARLGDAVAKNAPNIVSATENEFKRAVLQEVLEIRIAQEESILQSRRQTVANQDTGFFGRKKKEEEKARTIATINQQVSKLRAFQNEINIGGIGSNHTYSVRQIMAEIMLGLDCSRDESQSMRLRQLMQSFEGIFKVRMDGPGGVNDIYNAEKTARGEDRRAEMLVGKYGELCGPQVRKVMPMPDITRYVMDLNGIISQLGNLREQRPSNEREM
jgi:hypothetical protein